MNGSTKYSLERPTFLLKMSFIISSTMSGNVAVTLGGAIHARELLTTVSVVTSTVRSNEARTGGGMFVTTGAEVSIERSTISDNTATGSGGGIALQGTPGSAVELVNER